MPRYLITDPFPCPPVDLPDGSSLVAPSAEIGVRLGRSSRSLYRIAKDALKRSGFGIPTPIMATRKLRSAIRETTPGTDSSAIARLYREAVAAILRSGIDTSALAEFGSERSRTAALITERYRNSLSRLRLVDRDAALTESIRAGVIEPRPVVIYGYFRARQLPARPEEIDFIDRLAADGSIFYLPCGDEPVFSSNRAWIDLLLDRGWEVQQSAAGLHSLSNLFDMLAKRFAAGTYHEPRQIDGADAIVYPDLVHEVRETLASVKAKVFEGVPIDQIAIVCRDLDSYAGSMIATAREYNLPVRIDHEVPIVETELGRFVTLIFEVVDRQSSAEITSGTGNSLRGFLYEPTVRLMLHRLGPGLSEEQRSAAYETLPSNYDAWRSITNDAELLFTHGERSTKDWVTWLRSLLGRWEIRSKEKLGRSPEEIKAYDRFFRSLEQSASDDGAATIHIAQFAADVADILANVSTPLHTSLGGVRIAEPNDMPGCSYDNVFIVGMAEGSLPAVAADRGAIDLYECERLRSHGIHFQDALEVPRWEAQSFYFTLLACRRQITFSYPKFSADREQIQSSYFKRLGLVPQPAVERYVSSQTEYRRAYLADRSRNNGDDIFTSAFHQLDVEQRRESVELPDEYDGVIGIPIRRSSWSATSLAKFGSCRFKWFASYVLLLREPAEADTDLPANTRGTLLHKTLELAVGHSRTEPDLRKAVLDALETAFSEAEQLDGSLTLISNWELRRTEQIEKLRMAVSSRDFIANGASVIGVEKEFRAELCGLTIRGTIDRIDRLANDSILAVDYKYGTYLGKVKDENGYLTVEIQLPLYCDAALPKLYPNDQLAGGQFFHLAEPKITKIKETDLVTFLEGVKHSLELGNFAVDPDVKGDACTYCEFDVVCRVGPRLSRKPV